MAIYQIKLRGEEGILSYDTYRAANAEDAVRQFLESQEHSKQNLGDRYEPTEIGEVKLPLDMDDPNKALKNIDNQLFECGNDLCHLGEILGLIMQNKSALSLFEMESFIKSIKEKAEQIYSLLGALYDIKENKHSYFFKKKESTM